jgi:flagellar biosynthetic protein FliQ
VLVSLLIGLLISIFQTVTSIQEQTLTFAPRILAVGLVLVFTMPWTLEVLMNFTQRMFWLLAETTR